MSVPVVSLFPLQRLTEGASRRPGYVDRITIRAVDEHGDDRPACVVVIKDDGALEVRVMPDVTVRTVAS